MDTLYLAALLVDAEKPRVLVCVQVVILIVLLVMVNAIIASLEKHNIIFCF